MPDDLVSNKETYGGRPRAVVMAEQAASRSARHFWQWSQVPAAERAALLLAVADRLADHRDALCKLAAEEIGSSIQWIDFNIAIAQDILRQAASLAPHLEPTYKPGRRAGSTHQIQRRPVGVSLGFAPWNAPIILCVRALAVPLLCGNTAIIKTSDFCPRTHQRVVDIFVEAGIPAHVVQAVSSGPEHSRAVAQSLIHHPAVRRVNFTGSTRVGRFVAEECGRAVKRSLMELSDIAPMIVLEGADLDAAVSAASFGSFFNQGQICMSTERILLEDSIADQFTEKLVAKVSTLRAADPAVEDAVLGRLVNETAAIRLREMVEDALANGAVLRAGGDVEGTVMQPTVVDGVAPNMRLYSEESFGPIAALIRCFDEEEAISIANDTPFGLTASVFGPSERAHAVADRLETGICQINGPSVYDDPNMPFGGVKASGFGRFGGEAALDEFTEIRWVADHTGLSAQDIDAMLYQGRT